MIQRRKLKGQEHVATAAGVTARERVEGHYASSNRCKVLYEL
jgi:hypothetical protein